MLRSILLVRLPTDGILPRSYRCFLLRLSFPLTRNAEARPAGRSRLILGRFLLAFERCARELALLSESISTVFVQLHSQRRHGVQQ